MRFISKYYLYVLTGILLLLSSCEKLFNPELGNVIDETEYYRDWEEYRSAGLGLYALQQNLVDQIVVLGELRADLVEVTDQADRDLFEIYNFDVSPSNKYASPVNFYKLIVACNNLKTKLETEHPEVIDKESSITSYDRLYGEVLCMRAWAYFNAVRIWGKIPYIYPSLSEISEIKAYVNSPKSYVDTLKVIYPIDGFHSDTIRDSTIVLDKAYLNLEAVIDTFLVDLEENIKAVGVIHNKDFSDPTWDVTIWNSYARHVLLGQLYLYQQNYTKALEHFDPIMFNYDSESSNIMFGLDSKFAFDNWDEIFSQIDPYEHIYTLWFDKAYQQTNNLQTFFSKEFPNRYMLKPTAKAIQNWEHMWDGMQRDEDNTGHPELTRLARDVYDKPIHGDPGDFYRGYGSSFVYIKNDEILDEELVREMLENKAEGNMRLVNNTMEGVDTMVYKYSISKNSYDHDANFMIFRAAGVHFYYAEIFVWRVYLKDEQEVTKVLESFTVINNGYYNEDANQLGVRGRVGFADGDEALTVGNIVYEHDPSTNEVIGYKELDNFYSKQLYMEELIIEEKAREMAFEGERFYDLMRIALRRGDPAFLADKVSAKFSGSKREEIRQKLMNESNWYLPLFEDFEE